MTSILSTLRAGLVLFLLGALSCNDTPYDGTGISKDHEGGEKVTSPPPANEKTGSQGLPDSSGTPALQVKPTDGNTSRESHPLSH